MKTTLLLTLLVANVSAHAERNPIFAAKYFGTFYTVITRTDDPLRFEECAVLVEGEKFREAVNQPGAECRDDFGPIRRSSDMRRRFSESLNRGARSQLAKTRRDDGFTAGSLLIFAYANKRFQYEYKWLFSKLRLGAAMNARQRKVLTGLLIGGAALQVTHMLFAKTPHVDPAISGQFMASDVSVVNLETHMIIRAALKDMKGK